MARTDLTVGQIVRAGLNEQAGAAGIVDGHKFINDGRVYVRVDKSSSSGDITFKTPIQRGGLAVAELAVSITPGTEQLIGPFPVGIFNQSDGKVHVDYQGSEETEFTVQVYRL